MRKSAGAIVILTMAAAIPSEAQTHYDTVQVRVGGDVVVCRPVHGVRP